MSFADDQPHRTQALSARQLLHASAPAEYLAACLAVGLEPGEAAAAAEPTAPPAEEISRRLVAAAACGQLAAARQAARSLLLHLADAIGGADPMPLAVAADTLLRTFIAAEAAAVASASDPPGNGWRRDFAAALCVAPPALQAALVGRLRRLVHGLRLRPQQLQGLAVLLVELAAVVLLPIDAASCGSGGGPSARAVGCLHALLGERGTALSGPALVDAMLADAPLGGEPSLALTAAFWSAYSAAGLRAHSRWHSPSSAALAPAPAVGAASLAVYLPLALISLLHWLSLRMPAQSPACLAAASPAIARVLSAVDPDALHAGAVAWERRALAAGCVPPLAVQGVAAGAVILALEAAAGGAAAGGDEDT
jgi:hypothetical protein